MGRKQSLERLDSNRLAHGSFPSFEAAFSLPTHELEKMRGTGIVLVFDRYALGFVVLSSFIFVMLILTRRKLLLSRLLLAVQVYSALQGVR